MLPIYLVPPNLPYPEKNQGKWSREHQDYQLGYVHPRDLDGGQPMLDGLPLARRFKSYVGTKNAAEKLKRWLKDFRFTDIATADRQIAWDSVPHFEL